MTKTEARRIVAGLARRLDVPPPKVELLPLHRSGWSGRYHPKDIRIVVKYGGKRGYPDLKKTLLGHELSHWATRVIVCRWPGKGRVKKSCTYKGQHDRRFYETLAKIHRILNTPMVHAMMLERKSGYRPPSNWMRS
jgi:hypothetical protein